jgi:hypothetical protein
VSGRVRIGTCTGPADAALVRSVFAAHGIGAVIGAEHHAGLLGPLGGAFLSLDISVAEDDAEDAVALLRDLRERSAGGAPGDEDEDEDEDEAEDEAIDTDEGVETADAADAAGVTTDTAADANPAAAAGSSVARPAGTRQPRPASPSSPGESLRWRLERRRRTAAVLLLGAFLGFGTAHMFTRAWLRGITLAGLEILGLRELASGNPLGGVMVASAILYDLFGAMWRVRTQPRTTLPVARLRAR